MTKTTSEIFFHSAPIRLGSPLRTPDFAWNAWGIEFNSDKEFDILIQQSEEAYSNEWRQTEQCDHDGISEAAQLAGLGSANQQLNESLADAAVKLIKHFEGKSIRILDMRISTIIILLASSFLFISCTPDDEPKAVSGTEYHVSPTGNDGNDGSVSRPLKTISAAAAIAKAGDVITVAKGTYRERINPPRGGESNYKRITYQAAEGQKVLIKGSEIIKGWEKVQDDTWKVSVDNAMFGSFNPYKDLINGDWFWPMDREYHTGAVYLNNHWLTEAKALEDVLKPVGAAVASYSSGGQQFLMNLNWFKVNDKPIKAADFTDQNGIHAYADENEGECVGWIEHGDWIRYEGVDLGSGTSRIEFNAASGTRGGIIEIRLNSPDGKLLDSCKIDQTGGWQSWSSFKADLKPSGGINTICLVFKKIQPENKTDTQLWYAKVDSSETTIWAQFQDVNPNESQVEINVRQSIFYPEQTGIDYITVRGFTMMHAATPWAPPTAEQIGLIGTNWSKGWIIEDNDISYSVCTGITLGKYGDQYDNTSANTADGYIKTIERALERGWSKENIGSHIVRNNHISHCEQAGLVGSMGAVFSTITGNEIHDIHVRQLFTGAEMAGIKIHAPIDTLISNNHIYRTVRGVWLDWMTQGTRVTGNLLYDNWPDEDLFVEVNHGPFLVDNNIMLSPAGLLVNSQGGAYVHNLIVGDILTWHEELRKTPYHKAHSTEMVALADNPSGDDRVYNNIIVNGEMTTYDGAKLPVFIDGNVFLNGAKASKHESNPVVAPEFNPDIKLIEKSDGMELQMRLDKSWAEYKRQIVTTEMLGKAVIPGVGYVMPTEDNQVLKVWPMSP
jgi:hypothetical protein